eukprot:14282621-Ditylum_brightwellii.AAC.1
MEDSNSSTLDKQVSKSFSLQHSMFESDQLLMQRHFGIKNSLTTKLSVEFWQKRQDFVPMQHYRKIPTYMNWKRQ